MLAPSDELKSHPAADLFPMMDDASFAALKADIEEHGQHQPIIIYANTILDGRNRYRACRELGIEAESREWSGKGSPLAFVISNNLVRRHLSTSQRAMIAARISNLNQGKPTDNATEKLKCLNSDIWNPISVPEAAELLNVASCTVKDARMVLLKCNPTTVKAVDDGKVSIHTARASIKTLNTSISGKRNAARKAPAKTAKNLARIETIRSNAAIWAHVRTGLIEFASLPLPADVAPIVKTMDRAGLVDKKLPGVLAWLKEFEKCRS